MRKNCDDVVLKCESIFRGIKEVLFIFESGRERLNRLIGTSLVITSLPMKKILIIEDDEELRENLVEILQLANYVVVSACDGKEGLGKALKEAPDLILCDITMPVLDGFGVLGVLNRHPETFAIPFIFLTGKQELSGLRKGMSMGADDYLVKPINENDLLDTIEIRLKKKESLKRHVVTDAIGVSNFIPKVNGAEDLNLTSSLRDTHHYKKKHLLYSEGERPVYIYFVVSGKLKEFMINEEGKELITNMYTKGDFFGYIPVLEDMAYIESVQMLEDTELILIPKSNFLQIVHDDHQVAQQFIKLLSHNIRENEEKLLNLAYSSLRKKVAKGIIEVIDKFSEKKDGKPVIEISREDLACVVGSAQESMIRILREFKGEQLIDTVEGNIYVLNENKLRHLKY